MSNFIIKLAQREDMCRALPHLRDSDIEEMKQATGLKNEKELTSFFYGTFKASTGLCYAVYVDDGNLLCMFGVYRVTTLRNVGNPWLIGTKLMEKHRVFIAKNSKKFLDILLNEFSVLESYVPDSNEVAKRWLQWLGFELYSPQPYGVNKTLFCKYRKGKKS